MGFMYIYRRINNTWFIIICSAMSTGVSWQLINKVSEKPIGLIFEDQTVEEALFLALLDL
jgi:hypothetical protein